MSIFVIENSLYILVSRIDAILACKEDIIGKINTRIKPVRIFAVVMVIETFIIIIFESEVGLLIVNLNQRRIGAQEEFLYRGLA